jgi:hypothetical protein
MATKGSKKAKPKAKKSIRDLPLRAGSAKQVKGGVKSAGIHFKYD